MIRIPFVVKTLLATLFLSFARTPEADAQEEKGLTMSGGALIGGANGTHGA
jgi:hypothetical protein